MTYNRNMGRGHHDDFASVMGTRRGTSHQDEGALGDDSWVLEEALLGREAHGRHLRSLPSETGQRVAVLFFDEAPCAYLTPQTLAVATTGPEVQTLAPLRRALFEWARGRSLSTIHVAQEELQTYLRWSMV